MRENIKTLLIEKSLKLDCGQVIDNFQLAYETYGELNRDKDNAILVFHALTGDQFVTGTNPITKKDGWWTYAVGPNKSIDTKYSLIKGYNLMSTLEEGAIKTLKQKKFLVTQISIKDDFDSYCYLIFYLIFDIYLRAKFNKINFLDQPAVEILKKNTKV